MDKIFFNDICVIIFYQLPINKSSNFISFTLNCNCYVVMVDKVCFTCEVTDAYG
jgi:hypothetical protein